MENMEGHSFILIQDLTADSRMIYVTDSVEQLLGWAPNELYGKSFYGIVHPEEVAAAQALHYEHVRCDKAATLTYLRLKHKSDGYTLCSFSRSVMFNQIVGGISIAPSELRGRITEATAEEVFVLSLEASHLAFQRWGGHISVPAVFQASSVDQSFPIDQLMPRPSRRTAILLNRFSNEPYVIHCNNDCIINSEAYFHQKISDFIRPESRFDFFQALEVVKGWGTNWDDASSSVFGRCDLNLETRQNPPSVVTVQAIISAHSDAILVLIKPV